MVYRSSMEAEREEGTTRGSLTPDDDGLETQRGHNLALDEETMAITEPPPLPSSKPAKAAPQLQLVPSPKEADDVAAWPFAEDDPSSLINSAPPEPRRRRPKTLRPERFGARDRRQPPTVGTGLKQFPLPPPTEFGASDLHLRRDESVIAEARFVKNSTLNRVRKYARRASTVMSERGYAFASSLGEQSVAAIRRFEGLPRKKQLVWVAAPYMLALVLVFVLLQVRSGSPEAAMKKAPDVAAATLAPAMAAVVPAPAPDEEQIPLVPPGRIADEPKAAASDIGKPDVGAGVIRKLPIRTRLLARPEPGRHSAKLRAGAEVTVFPDFPAPSGFVLAQSQKGTIGFLSVLHLDGKRDPALDRKANKKKRQRARRRARRR